MFKNSRLKISNSRFSSSGTPTLTPNIVHILAYWMKNKTRFERRTFILWFTYKDGSNTRIRFVNWLTMKDNNTESKIYQRYYLYKLLWWKFTLTKINLRFSSIGPKWLQKSSSPRAKLASWLSYFIFIFYIWNL